MIFLLYTFDLEFYHTIDDKQNKTKSFLLVSKYINEFNTI